MSKKLSREEFAKKVAGWLIKKFKENEQKGYRGLGLIYSGIWSAIKVKYEELYGKVDAKELIDLLNTVLESKGFKIVPDGRARLKMVRIGGESVKREIIEELEEILS